MKFLRSFFLLLFCLALFIFLIFYHQKVGYFLTSLKGLMVDFFTQGLNYQKQKQLELENQSLKLELKQLQKNATHLNHLKAVEVFSTYPFLDSLSLMLNSGQNDGIRIGMSVFASKNILVGKIKDVKKNLSEAETIFSPLWKESVAIGSNKIKAVLKGGSVPQLELIPQEAKIKTGDEVINISPDLPYGAFLGFIGEIENSNEPWLKAFLKTPYQLADLNEVFIMTDYEIFN